MQTVKTTNRNIMNNYVWTAYTYIFGTATFLSVTVKYIVVGFFGLNTLFMDVVLENLWLVVASLVPF